MAILSAHARVAGIIGWPVGHSRSPRLHGYWLEKHGIDGAYIPLPIPPEHFRDTVRGLMHAGFAGANVTIPHKLAAFEVCDTVDETARRAGAVNTLTFRDGKITGANTDGWGFLANLRAHGVDPKAGPACFWVRAAGLGRSPRRCSPRASRSRSPTAPPPAPSSSSGTCRARPSCHGSSAMPPSRITLWWSTPRRSAWRARSRLRSTCPRRAWHRHRRYRLRAAGHAVAARRESAWPHAGRGAWHAAVIRAFRASAAGSASSQRSMTTCAASSPLT